MRYLRGNIVTRQVIIREEQLAWIEKNHIDLSRFVQAAIDDSMDMTPTKIPA